MRVRAVTIAALTGIVAAVAAFGAAPQAGATTITPSKAVTAGTAGTTGTAVTAGTAADPGVVSGYQQDAAHDGVSTGAVSPTATKAWSRNLQGTVSYPVVAGGRVFVTTTIKGNNVYGDEVYALSLKTGRTLWGPVTIPGMYSFAALTYANGRLFVINSVGIKALDAATGTQLWSTDLNNDSDAAPTAANNQVYAVGADTLYALRQDTGQLEWTRPVVDGGNASPAVGGGSVYTSFACEYTQAFTLSGRPRWTDDFGCQGGGGETPVLAGGALWVRDNFSMPGRVLSPNDGSVRFTYAGGLTPAVNADHAVICNGTQTVALDPQTGSQQWVQAADGGLDTPAVLAGGVAYVGSSTGSVYGLELSQGRIVWTASAGAPIKVNDRDSTVRTGLAVSGNTLLVPASTTLVAFR